MIEQITLPVSGIDWDTTLQAWSWLFGETPNFTIWVLTRFGELFAHKDDDSVWRLDPSCGQFECVAASKDEFDRAVDEPDNIELWFMPGLIKDLETRGLRIGEGQCYGFATPTGLGGELNTENVKIFGIEPYLKAMGELWGRLKDIPDGTEVVIRPDP